MKLSVIAGDVAPLSITPKLLRLRAYRLSVHGMLAHKTDARTMLGLAWERTGSNYAEWRNARILRDAQYPA